MSHEGGENQFCSVVNEIQPVAPAGSLLFRPRHDCCDGLLHWGHILRWWVGPATEWPADERPTPSSSALAPDGARPRERHGAPSFTRAAACDNGAAGGGRRSLWLCPRESERPCLVNPAASPKLSRSIKCSRHAPSWPGMLKSHTAAHANAGGSLPLAFPTELGTPTAQSALLFQQPALGDSVISTLSSPRRGPSARPCGLRGRTDAPHLTARSRIGMDTLVQSQTPHLQKMADDEDDKKLRRREQNRLSAQRSYHKKQERLQTLRSQVAQLEATYQQHVSSISSSAVPASPSGLLPIPSHSVVSSPATSHSDDQLSSDEKTDRVSPSSPPPPPSHLQDLLSSRTQLQNENDALRRRIDEHTRFQFRLQSLAAGEEAAASDASVQLVHNSITGSPRFQPRIQMKRPLTVEECYTLGSNAYQHMRRHRFPDNYMTTGSSMCGWTDKRVLENGLLKVELRKTFHGHPIDTVARDAWNSVQDPRKMDSLYSLNMNMHSEIVQRIDDNNVVMYQSYETPERNASGNETGAVCVMHHVRPRLGTSSCSCPSNQIAWTTVITSWT